MRGVSQAAITLARRLLLMRAVSRAALVRCKDGARHFLQCYNLLIAFKTSRLAQVVLAATQQLGCTKDVMG